ncbi:inorganic triphosphatase [Erwinia sp. OLTSP20]|uniref:CYTH domain-containing protein n=1 Tax=unclassified Erwinia TaxID=2622719 RepID=UPI000C19455E|nr:MULTISPECIES: inorganic triphosphatase [unclassified Erwinia]PIJ49488.1 inorganic triphosphatase [Erwinia sp. OAMSP11]PIJ69688.1 inorganic triphosphatase [Erwinia sp. OLSSP12]PIJ79479.1 inorganic triphosphatase [Erwinia sp. OLCASP19]PIJ81694.1 inorganic triphosphatase [Erwinia sp. OLMTSP26]PIJ84377.1 inorganic triphosphatase [Erwinia sp. OLMDSP33]
MTIEIEIKFIANEQAVLNLPQWLAAWPHQHIPGEKLTNIYYETADNQLRRWDIGLRIRGFGDSYEMTLKGKGASIGGLHQRAEYNIPLSQPTLDIALLPQTVWPDNTDVTALQKRLSALFSTHFIRERWLVNYQQSEIEVALDRGEVVAGSLSEPLHEIELELKSGTREELMAFAGSLAGYAGLRLGSLSKAARGYALAQGNPERPLRPVPLLKVKKKASVEEGMQAALQLGLAQWQYHEELWLRDCPDALAEIKTALSLIRETLTLFGALVPRKASASLRQKLTALENSLEAESPDAASLCFSPDWLQAQLALTDWLAGKRWQSFLSEKDNARLQGSFKRFADIMLSRIAADLRETFQGIQLSGQYQDKLIRLQRQLQAVHLLGGAYDPVAVTRWLEPWQLLAETIMQRQQSQFKAQTREALKQSPFWKHSGQ